MSDTGTRTGNRVRRMLAAQLARLVATVNWQVWIVLLYPFLLGTGSCKPWIHHYRELVAGFQLRDSNLSVLATLKVHPCLCLRSPAACQRVQEACSRLVSSLTMTSGWGFTHLKLLWQFYGFLDFLCRCLNIIGLHRVTCPMKHRLQKPSSALFQHRYVSVLGADVKLYFVSFFFCFSVSILGLGNLAYSSALKTILRSLNPEVVPKKTKLWMILVNTSQLAVVTQLSHYSSCIVSEST